MSSAFLRISVQPLCARAFVSTWSHTASVRRVQYKITTSARSQWRQRAALCVCQNPARSVLQQRAARNFRSTSVQRAVHGMRIRLICLRCTFTQHFCRNGQEGQTASLCQISSKSLEPRPRYWDFSIFEDDGSCHLWFPKFEIFNVRNSQEGRNRSNRDMVIFGFFKMAAAAILDFRNFEFLTVGRVTSVDRTVSLCQISSKSLVQRPRYVTFNIMLIWLENAYSRPFWVFWAHFPQMISLIVLTPKRKDH